MFGETRRNSSLRLPIRGSNPVACSGGGESFFRAKTAGQPLLTHPGPERTRLGLTPARRNVPELEYAALHAITRQGVGCSLRRRAPERLFGGEIAEATACVVAGARECGAAAQPITAARMRVRMS